MILFLCAVLMAGSEIKLLFFFPAKSTVKVGIPEFLNGVGKGVEKHVEKLESEIGDLNKLLVTRTIKLKRLGIPCQDVSTMFALWIFMYAWMYFYVSTDICWDSSDLEVLCCFLNLLCD